MRDVSWDLSDYQWLASRCESRLSAAERAAFADAPRLMDARKDREDGLDSCEKYNRQRLYAGANKDVRPVARISARHEGVPDAEGKTWACEHFRGVEATLELVEEARVILIHNLWVDAGLSNGSQGTVKAIVYRGEGRPEHPDPEKRLPAVVLIEFRDYSGPAFFEDSQRQSGCRSSRRRWRTKRTRM